MYVINVFVKKIRILTSRAKCIVGNGTLEAKKVKTHENNSEKYEKELCNFCPAKYTLTLGTSLFADYDMTNNR